MSYNIVNLELTTYYKIQKNVNTMIGCYCSCAYGVCTLGWGFKNYSEALTCYINNNMLHCL